MQSIQSAAKANSKLIVGFVIVIAVLVLVMNGQSGAVNAAGLGAMPAVEPAGAVVDNVFTGFAAFQKSFGVGGNTQAELVPAAEAKPAGQLMFQAVKSTWAQTAGIQTRCSAIDSNLDYQGDATEAAVWKSFTPDLKQWYFDQCSEHLAALKTN